MPRSSRIRRYLQEVASSPRVEQFSFIIPFLIVVAELILMNHAIQLKEGYIIVLTSFLLSVSILELVLIIIEIHEHQQEKILTIKLDDFIMDNKDNNVKDIVLSFIKQNPEYNKHRNEIYHLACQILDTHREEEIQSKIDNTLKKFINKSRGDNVGEIIENFLEKYPEFKSHRDEIYHKTCQLLYEEE